MQKKIFEVYEKLEHPDGFKDRASFLNPTNFLSTEDGCFYLMDRLYPIEGDLIYQIYLNEPSYDFIIRDETYIRGHYIGYEQIKKIIQDKPRTSETLTNMEQLYYDLGRLLAIMHLGAQIDGRDVEYVLSKRSKNNDLYYKISIIDFNLVSSMKNLFNEKNSEQIVLTIVNNMMEDIRNGYIASPNEWEFNEFRKGYFYLAIQLDNLDDTKPKKFYLNIAKNIFRNIEYSVTYTDFKFEYKKIV
jgi:hypothetical protein